MAISLDLSVSIYNPYVFLSGSVLCISIFISIHLSVCVFIYLSAYQPRSIFFLSVEICLAICLSIYCFFFCCRLSLSTCDLILFNKLTTQRVCALVLQTGPTAALKNRNRVVPNSEQQIPTNSVILVKCV